MGHGRGACGSAGPPGRTVETWLGARKEASADILSGEPVPMANVEWDSLPWRGTAAELLGGLEERISEQVRARRDWPRTARALAGSCAVWPPICGVSASS
jgi:hypothetical protein